MKGSGCIVVGGIALSAVAILMLWLSLPLDRTITTLTNPQDYVEHGQQFGVRIGESHDRADRILLGSGLIAEDPGVNRLFDNCGLRPTQPDERVAFYGDRSWRRGYVCLVVRDERVVAVGWSFGPFAP